MPIVKRPHSFVICCAAISFGLAGCANHTADSNSYADPTHTRTDIVAAAPAPVEASLYERLGGMSAIEAVVDQTVTNIGGDSRINSFFLVDLQNLRVKLSEQICDLAGGPCEYTGLDMREAHKNMALNDAHFDALVEALVAALNQFNVPEKEQTELLTPLAAMRDDVLNR